MPGPSSSGFERAKALEALADQTFDVVVIGGGITGCGVALDAAARGLRTALVEGRDFSSGTSSKSSKLVHGGLRYLQQRDFRLVYEALAERQRLLQNAPHLVHPLPFLIPLFGKGGVVSKSVAKTYSSALWMYDLTGGLRIGKRHGRLDAAGALKHFPVLNAETLVDSFIYWDAQTDDARLTLAVARAAAQTHGATIVNHAPVAGFLEDEDAGTVRGVRLENGIEVRAEVVVNAGGVWAEQIDRLDPTIDSEQDATRPAKGVHLMVPSHRLPCDYASVLNVPGDKRSVFVVPWLEPGYTYIGTTDTDYGGDIDHPMTTTEDRDYLLKTVNHWTKSDLGPDDVTGSWAGLRPLIKHSSARTADLSRRHRVTTSPRRIVTVTGGKLTTYRAMAADTVDEVVAILGRRLARTTTRRLPLWGAEAGAAPDFPAGSFLAGDHAQADHAQANSANQTSTDQAQTAHLHGRYGSEAGTVRAMISNDPSLGKPLVPGLPYLRAEATFAVRYEMAQTLEDVLARRTRALILDRKATVDSAGEVARLVAPELGWSDQRIDQEVRDLTKTAQTEASSAGLSGSPISVDGQSS